MSEMNRFSFMSDTQSEVLKPGMSTNKESFDFVVEQ